MELKLSLRYRTLDNLSRLVFLSIQQRSDDQQVVSRYNGDVDAKCEYLGLPASVWITNGCPKTKAQSLGREQSMWVRQIIGARESLNGKGC